ncbi:MAG: hypothetical protein GX175_07370 [Halanaerobiaceae bacterium]|nr:hypothetical protein [Halanaerobiaceae bacterium]
MENDIAVYCEKKEYLDLSRKIIRFIWYTDLESDIFFELVQDTHKSKVYRFSHDKTNYYLKYYTPIAFNKIIKNQFREIEALRHYNTARGLQSAGIPSVNPVLAIIKKNNLFYKESILVMEEIEGLTLEDYLRKPRPADNIKNEIIKQFAGIYAKLINNKYLHQDPMFCNFMIKGKDEDSIEIVLIDVDNIYKLPFFTKRMIVYSLVKFNNLVLYDLNNLNLQYPDEEDIKYFIRKMLEECNHSLNERELLDTILKKSAKRIVELNGNKYKQI